MPTFLEKIRSDYKLTSGTDHLPSIVFCRDILQGMGKKETICKYSACTHLQTKNLILIPGANWGSSLFSWAVAVRNGLHLLCWQQMVIFCLSKGRWFSVIIFSFRSFSLDLWYSQCTYSLCQIENNALKWSGHLSLACARSVRKNCNRLDPKTQTYSAQLDCPEAQNGDFTSRLPSKHSDAAVSAGYFIHQSHLQ